MVNRRFSSSLRYCSGDPQLVWIYRGWTVNQYDYSDFEYTRPTPPAAPEPIDWDTVAEIFPACFSALCWILWAAFLLTPSLFGLHYAAMFSTANNVVFVLMGFVLCSAISVAIRAGHGMRAVFFGLGIFLLSFWF